MKRDNVYALSAVLVLIVAVSVFAAVVSYSLQSDQEVYGPKKPFYLGVTYCGSSVDEARQLVDRVKNYTNLFVVQSAYLQLHLDELNQVCDYAVNNGLDIIVYFGAYYSQKSLVEKFLAPAESKWGSHLVGLYYNDEPGGKMLDSHLTLGNITKYEGGYITRIDLLTSTYEKQFLTADYKKETSFDRSGKISVETKQSLHQNNCSFQTDRTVIYRPNGTVVCRLENWTSTVDSNSYSQLTLLYQPDGSVQDQNGTYVTDQGDINQFTSYQQIWDSRPMQTYADAADTYTAGLQQNVDFIKNQSSTQVFTSDYALYWFDYEAGYDTVLAQLGPNGNLRQEIALVRGAANMNDKQWGTILTWKNSTDPSSLMTGEEMYENLKLSYQSGAEYAVAFNYAPDVNGTGLLQDGHYSAIQRFWTDVVQNPDASNSITIHDALVLPTDYGWGMRSVNDTIWGLFPADDKSAQIWNTIQTLLSSKDGKVDVIYQDSTSQPSARYLRVHSWNST